MMLFSYSIPINSMCLPPWGAIGNKSYNQEIARMWLMSSCPGQNDLQQPTEVPSGDSPNPSASHILGCGRTLNGAASADSVQHHTLQFKVIHIARSSTPIQPPPDLLVGHKTGQPLVVTATGLDSCSSRQSSRQIFQRGSIGLLEATG